jgi:hypothetical protein
MSRPKWYTPVVVIALLWNVMGCAAYLMDVSLSAEAVAAMSPDEQSLYASRPVWGVAAYAIAVWGGLTGCIGLLLRKRWATSALMASLAGLLVQDGALFGLANVAIPTSVFILQGIVLVVAILLLVLANTGTRRGWLI